MLNQTLKQNPSHHEKMLLLNFEICKRKIVYNKTEVFSSYYRSCPAWKRKIETNKIIK